MGIHRMSSSSVLVLVGILAAAVPASLAAPSAVSDLRSVHEHEIMGHELFQSITSKDSLTAADLPLNFTEHLHSDDSAEEIVKKMDASGDGTVDEEEFLRFVDPQLAKIWAISEFQNSDRDNSTTLEELEWKGCPQYTMQVDDTDGATHAESFKTVDSNSDGSISEVEYVRAARDLYSFIAGGAKVGATTSADDTISRDNFMAYGKFGTTTHWNQAAEDLFNFADVDKDGVLTRVEFCRIGQRGIKPNAHKDGEL